MAVTTARPNSRRHRARAQRSATVALLVAGLGVAAQPVALAHPAAVAQEVTAPGAHQRAVQLTAVNADPVEIYHETFSETTLNPQMITTYKGFTGSRYWTSAGACNGIVLSYQAPAAQYNDPGGTGSCIVQFMNSLRTIARALGGGGTAGETNKVASSFTNGSTASNEVQLETANIPVVAGRWYSASLRYGAFNCQMSSPIYNFYFVNPATSTETLIGGPINACNEPGSTTIDTVRLNTIQSPGSLKWQPAGTTPGDPSNLRLRVRNANGAQMGNDSAVDDLVVIQATPHIAKSFVPARGAAVGVPFLVRIVVDNTSELASKAGIDITDNLSAALTIGPDGVVANTCDGTATAVPGSTTFRLVGAKLDPDEASCTVDVQVVATATGAVTNGPGNLVTPLVKPTGDASVTVSNPQVSNDTAPRSPSDAPVTTDVIANDEAKDPAYPIDRTSVVFTTAGQPAGSTVSPDGKRLTVPGVGVYTVNPTTGAITFDPEPSFSGTTAPVTYSVTDSNGATKTGTLTNVVGAAPTADDDAASTPHDTTVAIDVLAGDTTDGSPVDPTSVVFPATGQPAGSTISPDGRTLSVPGQGVYTANQTTGVVTFDPDPAFSGTATTILYRMADQDGVTDVATVSVTVGAAPTADDEAVTTPFDTPVDVNVLDGDTSDPATTLDPTSVAFPTTGQPAGSTVSPDGKSLTVPGQGVYTVNPTTGAVRFDPDPALQGPAAPVTYRVADRNGAIATAEVTVTVGKAPTADDDVAGTTADTPVTVDVLDGDTSDPSTTLDPATVAFPATGQPAGATVTPDGKTLTVPGQGVYTVNLTTGAVTFDPEPAFSGAAAAVTYSVSDHNGATASAKVTVTVGAGAQAIPDTPSTKQGVTMTFDPVANDVAGQDAAGQQGSIDRRTVVFPTTGQPAGSTVSPDGKTVTVPGQGVYTIDPQSGQVTFDPEPDFTGPTAPVAYEVTDSVGNTVGSTITTSVTAVTPTVADDTASTPFGDTLSVDVLGNDSAGDPSAPLDPASVVFPAAGQPAGSTVSPDGKTLTVPGQGVYTVNAAGAVSFDPEDGFEGAADAVTYEVSDANGTSGTGTISVSVGVAPRAVNDKATAKPDTPVTVPVLANDTADPSTRLDPASVVFSTAGQPAGATVSPDGKTLTIPGEGVYTVDTSGAVTFAPVKGFYRAASPVTYAVTDGHGDTDTATLAVTVGAPPTANPDKGKAVSGKPARVAVLANDVAAPGRALDPASLRLTTTGLPAGSVLSSNGKTLTVPGQGRYTVGSDGSITFTPLKTFRGAAAAVTYSVMDTTGVATSSTLTMTVTSPTAPDPHDPGVPTGPEGPNLPVTGSSIGGLAASSVGLIALGALCLVLRRRRGASV